MDIEAGEEQHIEPALARPVAGDGRETVDVLVLPPLRGVGQQVLRVKRPVGVPDEVHGGVAVLPIRCLDQIDRLLHEAAQVRRQAEIDVASQNHLRQLAERDCRDGLTFSLADDQ